MQLFSASQDAAPLFSVLPNALPAPAGGSLQVSLKHLSQISLLQVFSKRLSSILLWQVSVWLLFAKCQLALPPFFVLFLRLPLSAVLKSLQSLQAFVLSARFSASQDAALLFFAQPNAGPAPADVLLLAFATFLLLPTLTLQISAPPPAGGPVFAFYFL